jgi:hypothetical protein
MATQLVIKRTFCLFKQMLESKVVQREGSEVWQI